MQPGQTPSIKIVSAGNRIEPQMFQQAAAGWLAQGHCYLAIDLSDLAFVESSGLGALVFVYKAAQQHGGQLVLFGLQAYVQKLVEITKLNRVLQIFETEAEARQALEAAAQSKTLVSVA